MKQLATLLLISLVTFASGQTEGNSSELHEKGLKKYGIEKAMIIYDVAEQPNDTLVIAFDRFGWRQVTMEHGEKLYYGLKTKINTKEIVDGHTTFEMNLKDKKGKIKVDRTITDLAGYKNSDELLEARMSKLKAVNVGTEEILGRECQVWQYESRGKPYKVWTWNGITLKHISPKGSRTALEINMEPELNEKLFVPPADVALTKVN